MPPILRFSILSKCQTIKDGQATFSRTGKSELQLFGSASPCLDAAFHLFVTDRPSRIGVSKASFDHTYEDQFLQNLVVRAVVRLVLKNFSDLLFRGRHGHIVTQGVDRQTTCLVRIAVRPLIYKQRAASASESGRLLHHVRMVGLAATCEGLRGLWLRSPEAMASTVRSSVWMQSRTEQVAQPSSGKAMRSSSSQKQAAQLSE